MRRYGLRDDQWDRIKDLLPGREGHVGGTAKDNRLFVEAVLYRFRTGCPWRDLPERFGDWKTPDSILGRLHLKSKPSSRKAKTGVFERIFKLLAVDHGNEYVMIDATIVRVHQHSADARKRDASHRPVARRAKHKNPRARRRARQSVRFDAEPWARPRSCFALNPCSKIPTRAPSSPIRRMMPVRSSTKDQGVTPVIPLKANRKSQREYDFALYCA